jgi:serine/threonine-protein kinase RsbW
MPRGGMSTPEPLRLGHTTPALAENVAPLRRAVVELAARAGADERTLADIALAVGEACGNVVVHAYPPGETGPLVLEAEVVDGRLYVTVSDQGRGLIPRPDSPGLGLGLPLIGNLCGSLEIDRGADDVGTRVQMDFALRTPAPNGV